MPEGPGGFVSNPNPVLQGSELRAFASPESQARPGNRNGLKHGLYTNDTNVLQLRARAVRRLVAKAYEVAPWLGPTDLPMVRKWAEVSKLGASMFAVLERLGPYRKDGEDLIARRLLGEYRLLAQLELAYAQQLGLTPASRAALGVDVAKGRAFDIATQIAEARATAARNGHVAGKDT